MRWMVWLLGVVVGFAAMGCYAPLRVRLRARAAPDLSCPVDQVSVSESGVGGWRATGCGAVASYVCTRSEVCVREGEVTSTRGGAAPLTTTAGPWSCRLDDTGSVGASAFGAALEERVSALWGCSAERIVLSVATSGAVGVEGASGHLECVEGALSGLVVAAASGAQVQCYRERGR
jgi:hypothetical protein